MAEAYAAEWLGLRRAADDRARDRELLETLRSELANREAPLIVDVGCGTGALRRALRAVAPQEARWRMVDRDASLLAQAGRPEERRELDLADIAALVDALSGADLVAASAFFDLASAAWIDAFVSALPQGAVVYAALTYDGRESWDPPSPDDAAVLAAFHRHQNRDFGLGPALGPGAARHLAERLRASGRVVALAPSDWRLERGADDALMSELAEGVAKAAAPEDRAASERWRAAPRQSARIGHWDILAAPPPRA